MEYVKSIHTQADREHYIVIMDLPFSVTDIAEGATDFLSACLQPNQVLTNPKANKGKPRKGTLPAVSISPLDFDAMTNFFSLENFERYLNCVPLPVDPRSPNTRAATQGLTFSFSNPREDEQGDSNAISDRRQDYSHREAAELSFMAEREAVMNGDRVIEREAVGNTIFQQWQQLGQNAFASDGQTPKASNHFHWPSVLFSPKDGVGEGGTSFDPDIKDMDTFPTVMTSADVPGGLWALSSNDPSIDYVSDGGGNETSRSASLMSYATCNSTGDERDHSYEVDQAEKEEDEEEKEYKDPVLMMRSPKNKYDYKSNVDWQLEMSCQDINNGMEGMLSLSTNAPNDDPMIAAQLAVTQTSFNGTYWKNCHEDEEQTNAEADNDDGEAKDQYFQPDPPASDSLEITEDVNRRESQQCSYSCSSSSCSSSSSTKSWENFEALDFQLGAGNNGEEDARSYSESDEVACLSFRDNLAEKEKGVIEQHTLPRPQVQELLTAEEPRKYTNEEEANRHFDEIFSSFELSLNRHSVDQSPASNIRGTGRKSLSPTQHNRKKSSPLVLAAHKMKSHGARKDARQEEQHHRENSCSSKFLMGTVMGRKLNHRPTPPSSPGYETFHDLEISIDHALKVMSAPEESNHRLNPPSPPGISYLEHSLSPVAGALESVIGRANKTLVQAYEITRRPTPPPSSGLPDAIKHLAVAPESLTDHAKTPSSPSLPDVFKHLSDSLLSSNDIASESISDRAKIPSSPSLPDDFKHQSDNLASSNDIPPESLIDRAKKTVFQAQHTLESMEYATPIEINVDEIIVEEPLHEDEQLQDMFLQQDISEIDESGLVSVVEVDEDCPDDEKTGMLSPNQFDSGIVGGNGSFDSSVNWDSLNYSMSDNVSTTIKCQASDVTSPKSNTSKGRPSFQTMKKVREDEDFSTPVIANRPPMSPNCVECEQQEVISQKQEFITKEATPAQRPTKSNTMISYIRRKKQAIPVSPSKHDNNANDSIEQTTLTFSPNHDNDAWDSIEQIKRRHNEEMTNIRLISENTIKATSSTIVACVVPPNDEATSSSLRYEKNVASIAPDTSSGAPTTYHTKRMIKASDGITYHVKQKKKNAETMTPRTFNSKMQVEVESRIDAMRELHKKNMDKMRDALDEINDGGVKSEGDHSENQIGVPLDASHTAQSVEKWQLKASILNKAKERHFSWRTSVNTPTHQGENESRSHFEFDDAITKKGILSPRVRDLMKKNEELEKEMREIMSFSPKDSISNAVLSPTFSGTNDFIQPSLNDLTTPSSARYTTPRSASNHLSTPSSARCTTPRSISGAFHMIKYAQTLHTITEQIPEFTSRAGHIVDVQSYPGERADVQ